MAEQVYGEREKEERPAIEEYVDSIRDMGEMQLLLEARNQVVVHLQDAVAFGDIKQIRWDVKALLDIERFHMMRRPE